MENYCLEKSLEKTDAMLRGHFELSSGLHSEYYFQCARLLSRPEEAKKAGEALANLFQDQGIQSVIAPALGGVVLSYVIAQALGVPSYFAERKSGSFELRRGFHIGKNEKVLVAEDVITTGGSVLEVYQLVKALGANPIGVASLVYRGEKEDPGFPCRYLLRKKAPLYQPEECPLCKKNILMDKPGSKKEESVAAGSEK